MVSLQVNVEGEKTEKPVFGELNNNNKSFANNTGYKLDEGKVRMELIPPELLYAVGQVLTYGAEKYHERNWEQGMCWGRCFGAMMRHMWSWWGGQGPTTKSFLFEDFDSETKMSHLWHAACCVTFLIAYEERGIGQDSRLKK